ncbi:MAG: hypothetical protein H6567_02465 [Lewinellaceae bacterium]|nr:hypothetical protein [Lewinellaceae bacterium]
MKPIIKNKDQKPTAKVSEALTKKYSGKIIFKEKYERVKSYFKDRDLDKEVELALKG